MDTARLLEVQESPVAAALSDAADNAPLKDLCEALAARGRYALRGAGAGAVHPGRPGMSAAG
jgi:hypothetical protein